MVVLLALSLTACSGQPTTVLTPTQGTTLSPSTPSETTEKDPLTKFSYTFTTSFDTVISIIGYDADQKHFDELAKMAEEQFVAYHQLYDIYHEYKGLTNLMSINQQAGQGPIKVDPRIIDLLMFYQEHAVLSQGKVSVTLGSVLSIWHDHRTAAESGKASVPDLNKLQLAAQHIDPTALKIDRAASTVEITDPATRLDVGAVAKGYATEAVARYLIEQGMTSGIINAGGSSVRLIGKPLDPDRATWAIGIQNPFASTLVPDTESLAVILNNDISIDTSGDYQRYYLVDGVMYHHLIDPTTLMPGRYVRAVTVMIENNALADYLSTTVFLMPYEEGRQLIESIPACEALWVFTDGTVQATDGLKAVLRDQNLINAKDLADQSSK
ncbi:MAG: FAD:protein FMN transferase [Eubacteriales bacterium]|nr:FAD:protein FMN transferase [Eubacteriales bacterium]